MLEKIKTNRGAALITAYFIIASLLTLTAGFGATSVTELENAQRYHNSIQSFWLAEAGINQFLHDTTMLDGADTQTIYLDGNPIVLTKDDSDTQKRIVTSTGTVNGTTREIEVEFPALPPEVFDNTMSSGGDITLSGLAAKMDVYGKTRISGSFSGSGGTNGWFEDKQEGRPTDETTLKVPDMDNNGTPDEFNDFVLYSNNVLNNYSEDEVVHVETDGTVTIIPNSYLAGKKIIFVEGSTPGSGDVNILFDASWQPNQNLTIISTGEVNYVQPLQFVTDSQLNIISWEGYYEPSLLLSAHTGITYTHGDADFFEILDYSETTGSLVANNHISALEVLAWKKFIYDSALTSEAVPPGFEGLYGSTDVGYSSTPSSWKEI